jgi:adenylate cyclase
VLFADCRDYTRLTQELGIEKVAPVTAEFFKASSRVIIEHDGIVDRLLGDACMAFFNVPIKHDDHVARAMNAAFAIQEVANRINERLRKEFVFNVGVGIATGTALATNMGSTNCNDYTLVGDAINVASRLQGEAAAGEILLTQDAYDVVHTAFPHADRREYQLKGIAQPVVAYAVQTFLNSLS